MEDFRKSDYLPLIFKISQRELGEYYVGAGCLVQTVWNYLLNFDLKHGITDIDIIYFDSVDLSLESERQIEKHISSLLQDLPFKIDVKNEARVHMWYEEKFGFKIRPYTSLGDAINTWPTTASSLGIRQKETGEFKVYAPYGLNDLFGMIVRPNKTQITKAIYNNKTAKWLKNWPVLKVIPWDA
ncbi:hypothetical protein CVD28_26305 [Bacillus sp. M6-12]|uniref:nucleotidyltransferase family protein n=1 Tax=Bacillus sp. M6-12 TaxID=2054166 RepID=UPI000C781047|nr:nucleotidyltransferase family protein [Bacillus sp. M6-12]PLS14812.1 hypothetical protein CVD28_26305 [Bacillus sp. M6-12]